MNAREITSTNSICPKMYANRVYTYGFVYIAHTRDVRTHDIRTLSDNVLHGLLYLSTTNTRRPSRHVIKTQRSTPIGPDRAATSLDRSTTLDANDGQVPARLRAVTYSSPPCAPG